MGQENPFPWYSPDWYKWNAYRASFKTVEEHLHAVKSQSPRCPYCGTPAGFSLGTGNCNCEDD